MTRRRVMSHSKTELPLAASGVRCAAGQARTQLQPNSAARSCQGPILAHC
jgi:hypothetical protein